MINITKPSKSQPVPAPTKPIIPTIGIKLPTQNKPAPQPDHAATQAAIDNLVTASTATIPTTPPPEVRDSKVNATILSALESLDKALEEKAPGMAEYIAIIHKNMREDPAQVVLMSDEERGIFFRGLKRVTDQEIIATTKGKKASKPSASTKTISVDDI